MAVVLYYGIYLIVTFLWDTANSLRITGLYVPRGAQHEAQIECRYDLEAEETLYDVKWYKDEMQFFRCMANGSVQEFPLEGVSLYYYSYAAVGSCPVKLTRLSNNSAGKYKCEVSLDAPKFKTVSEVKELTIPQYSRRTQEQNYSRRTQEQNDINPEKIKSSFQNQTNPSNCGMENQLSLLPIYLALFSILFCRF